MRFVCCELLSLSKIGPVQVNIRCNGFASFMLNWKWKYGNMEISRCSLESKMIGLIAQ